ncbi:MAG: pilus (MSHA type) biogenesis protein MshL [Thermodesulfobacteriota bacterium]|nr:pilus (MSHA type) biogenesis protein MshL [Thermodesulfobacteriota bacterium]
MKKLYGKTGSKAFFLVFFPLLVLSYCAPGPSSMLQPKPPSAEEMSNQMISDSEELVKRQKKLHESITKVQEKIPEIKPIKPFYNPMDDITVSFSMMNENLQAVLFALSRATGVNIIIDPDIEVGEKTITINFENVPATTVLNQILKTFDYHKEIDRNVIRIMKYKEKHYKLNFLDTHLKTSFVAGGDVLGSEDNTSTMRGLSGNFRLSGEGARNANPYDQLDHMIKTVLSKDGKYTLNRMSGSLYVKDRASVIAAVSRLINHYIDMMSRQIIIEARIIEVGLSGGHRYGIDWNYVKDKLSTTAMNLKEISWSIGSGLVLNQLRTTSTINAVINVLKNFGEIKIISNPSIRAKHGQPSIISVGTSFTYIKSVDTTSQATAAETSETTEVEVSTVFDGLILGVIPFIEEDGRVSLLINPIKSDVDPNSLVPERVGERDSISLPEVQLKEINTTIGTKSDDVIILGGLIDKRTIKDNQGVPYLSAIPLIGFLFKNESESDQTNELVIILKVNII